MLFFNLLSTAKPRARNRGILLFALGGFALAAAGAFWRPAAALREESAIRPLMVEERETALFALERLARRPELNAPASHLAARLMDDTLPTAINAKTRGLVRVAKDGMSFHPRFFTADPIAQEHAMTDVIRVPEIAHSNPRQGER